MIGLTLGIGLAALFLGVIALGRAAKAFSSKPTRSRSFHLHHSRGAPDRGRLRDPALSRPVAPRVNPMVALRAEQLRSQISLTSLTLDSELPKRLQLAALRRQSTRRNVADAPDLLS